jgi:leader peptidase (prepilin peptidase) / N-methyltransferase
MEIILSAIVGLLVGWLINRLADHLIASRSLPNVQHPLRAPLVILITGLAFALLAARYGFSIPALLMALYTFAFILIGVTDIEHRLIFDVVCLPAILVAALASPWSRPGWQFSLLGGAIAFASVLAIYIFAEIFSRMRHLRIQGGAFGQGDVKLATFVGIVVGTFSVIPALIYAILLGGIGALALILRRYMIDRHISLGAVMPYGPYFCIAGWAMMVFGSVWW